MTRFVRIAAFAALLAAAAPTAALANAKSVVDEAKANCVIGETVSGYLQAVRGSAPAEITAAMNEINIKRRAVYARLAREQNVAVDVVARLTGEKQIASPRSGECVRNASGAWIEG